VGVYENVPGNGPTAVVLLQNRGFFSTPNFNTYGRYHSAYVGDSWAIGRHIVVNAGYRWEQQMLQGSNYTNALTGQKTQVHYTFTDNWSPRFGLAIDPKGDRKTKIYGNYARTSYAIPLDLAIRSLSNEEDAEFAFFQPPFTDPSGQDCFAVPGACQLAVGQDGTITPALDDQHVLTPFLYTSYQSGEAIHKGTKMQYLEEYVGGVEHEFRQGIVASIRYQQRRLRRIVEDMSGVSPEAALLGVAQQFDIGNPTSALDHFVNPVEQIYPVGGLPPGCPNSSATGQPYAGTVFNPYDTSQGLADVCITNPDTAGNVAPDGIPDGFVTPVRTYKAVEVEISKSFNNGWQMRTNYRWSTLAGNYEGAFRNDNGQSDPSISSLFDFTPGSLNMLGNQFAVGFLNTDRRHIFNNFISYTFSRSFLRNLTLGTGVRIESGVPVNDLRAHPVYQNGGEIPVGGRGALGRTSTLGEGDIHTEYMVRLGERHSLQFGADLFNVANQKTQLRVDQFHDASLGTPNFDFKLPRGSGNIGVAPAFQRPFNARLNVKWVF
jgi:hypothetical protein